MGKRPVTSAISLLLSCLLLSPVFPGCGPSIVSGSAVISSSAVLGTPRLGAYGQQVGYAQGDLFQPRGVEALPDGACVVVDRTGRVQCFDRDGRVRRIWVLPEWNEGQPTDLCRTPWQTLLVADTHYSRVLEYDLEGREVRRFAVSDEATTMVRGVAVGLDGVIYVSEYGREDRVQRFDTQGNSLGTFGRRGEGDGEFMRPEGITVGHRGEVLIVDCGNHRVQRFTPEGVYLGSFGGEGVEPGRFLFPFDIATGSDDSLYVVDFQGNRVQRFAPDGTFLGSAGSTGREPGQFATPRGVAVMPGDRGDMVFVADTQNHRVQRFLWEYDL